MTGRKTAADNEGWRKGEGAYSKAKPTKSQDPWTQQADHPEKPSVTGRYTNNERVLRNKLPDEATAKTRSIDADVEANQRQAAIKYGVD